jgi:hypothetical protein
LTRAVRRVTPEDLRTIFNEGRYYERACANELLATIESSHAAPPQAGQPAGTMSEMVAYFDAAFNRLALVHQYRLPDGTLGDPVALTPNACFWKQRF